MVNWQKTVTTICCDAVDDEVTLFVHKDWSTSCTGYSKYHIDSEPGKEIVKLLKGKSQQLNRELRCEGLGCHRLVGYKNKLHAEEAKRGTSV